MNTTLEILGIAPSDIIVSDRLRAVDGAWVEAIAASMAQKGQDTPIKVRRDEEGRFHLVAGAHRLEACRKLDIDIRAEVAECSELEARLIEIDENLFRRELAPLDRAVFLAERKRVYLELHPETKNGAQGGRGGKTNENDTMSFSKETAQRINLSARSVERAIRIAEQIPADVRKRLIGTKIAEKQADLLFLAGLEPPLQRKVVTLVVEGMAKSLSAAAAMARGEGVPQDDSETRQLARLTDLWARSSDSVRASFLEFLDEQGARGA